MIKHIRNMNNRYKVGRHHAAVIPIPQTFLHNTHNITKFRERFIYHELERSTFGRLTLQELENIFS